jgi:hypothetical protein
MPGQAPPQNGVLDSCHRRLNNEHIPPVEIWTLLEVCSVFDEPAAKRQQEEGVYSVHDWAELKYLCEREGLSKKAAAEKLGMSRTTVYRLLALTEPPVYERRQVSSLLDPHKEAILAMLKEDATVRAAVIRERLQAQGYAGGITILKDFVAGPRSGDEMAGSQERIMRQNKAIDRAMRRLAVMAPLSYWLVHGYYRRPGLSGTPAACQ